MDIEILKEFIKPEILILIPVLYIVGIGIKKSKIKDCWIPALLGSVSVVLTALYVYATTDIHNSKDIAYSIFTVLTQGILVAAASVYVNQIFKQLKGGN